MRNEPARRGEGKVRVSAMNLWTDALAGICLATPAVPGAHVLCAPSAQPASPENPHVR